MSLRGRLVLLVATVVAGVIAIESYLEISTFERSVQDDVLQSAAATAQAVADDLELRGGLADTAQTPALLHEFLAATPTLRDIAALAQRGDTLTLLARTSSAPPDEVLPAARLAIDRGALTWTDAGRTRTVAVPVVEQGVVSGAVAVTVSLEPVVQIGARGRQVTLWFAIPAIILLTVLVDLLVQRFVHRPIDAIGRTMRRAGAGEAGVRTTIERRDEIGHVAAGLNDMLDRLEQFQTELQQRVDNATGELRVTNARLVESHQRIFALREALARAEQLAAMGQVAASVAHQIGTPLNLISGYVQVMIEEAQTDTAALHRLQTVEAQIGKVTEAIRSILDSARRPAGKREAVDVTQVVEQVCEISRPALHAANVELRLDVHVPVPTIMGDAAQLEVALFNLVSNSLDAMPGGGRLTISVSATANGIRLLVSDSGTGIPADVLPRIFDAWVTTKPAGRGTGLGLSIAHDTITSHGGSIEVRSQPGIGTEFIIELPALVVVPPLLNT